MNHVQLTYKQMYVYYRRIFRLQTVFSIILLLIVLLPGKAFSSPATPPPTITLAFSTEPMPPYYTISGEAQEIGGPWRKMLDELFIEKLGWQVRYLIRPWQRAQYEVKMGNADGFISIITEERLQYASPIPTTFCCFPLHLFTWKGQPKLEQMKSIQTVDELAVMDLALVSNIGNGWYQKNIESKGVKTTWLPTDEQVLHFVAMQRGDGLIDLPSSMAHLANKLGLSEQIIDTGVSFGNVKVHLMIGKASPLANRLAEIATAMKTIQENDTFAVLAAGSNEEHNAGNSGYLCECRKDQ